MSSVLLTAAFWRDLAERAARQASQTALPLVAAIGAAGTIDVKAVAVAIAGAVVLTVVKALATVKYTPGESLVSALLDRAVPAAAGTLLGLLPVDALDVTKVDWAAAGWASGASAVIALLAYYVAPPAVTPPAELQLAGGAPLGPTELL